MIDCSFTWEQSMKNESQMYFQQDTSLTGIQTKFTLPYPRNQTKISNVGLKSIIAYCIDDPNPPYKGVSGKAKVKISEDINHNMALSKKLLMSSVGSLENPRLKWQLSETERGEQVILELTPRYYSTWDFSAMG